MLLLLSLVLPMTFVAEDTIISSNPQIVLGLPGLNPVIPLWYGIIALIVALIVHEFSHGILTRAENIKVKSLGLIFFIIPLGAFCEPDEKELKETSNKKRMRVFAAGPTSNIVISFLCLAIMTSMIFCCVQPAANGIGVRSVSTGTPAEELGLEQGMIVTSINNTNMETLADFQQVMNNTMANQTVNISYVDGGNLKNEQVKLVDKYMIYYQELKKKYGTVNATIMDQIEYLKGKGYLGVGGTTQHEIDLKYLKNPFSDFPVGFVYYISMTEVTKYIYCLTES